MKTINPFRKSAIALAVGSATAVAGGMSSQAYAQEEAEAESLASLEEVVVTGSRIKRPDLSSVSPVSIVTGEEFVISGNLNIEQKLAELPQTLPSFGPSSNNPGDGTARVDLRGLGDSRTLVLVNGRRYIPATQTGVVDLNSIPGTLIKQVDVTTGGASAVYGSDALAGVVNFQLVDDFEGVELTTLYDVTSEGDGEKFNVDLTMGGNFDNGRGNAVVYASYARRDPVMQGDRDFSNQALGESGGILVPRGSSGVPGTRVFGGPTLPNGQTLGIFESDGSGRAFRDPEDRFNYAPDNFLQLPQERYLVTAMAHYDITEKARVYGELTSTRNQVDQELAPTPAFLTIVVNPDSPFFGADVQQALNGIRSDTNGDGVINGSDNATIPYIGRRMVENGSRRSLDTRTGNRILLGIDGELNDNWGFDAYYTRSTLDNTNLLKNDVSRSRFLQALLVTDDGTACQNPANGCVPINIFGAGNISQAAVGFVNVGATNVTSITQDVWSANVSGTLGTVGSATNPVGLVVGLEHRKEDSSFTPDTFLASGDVLGFNAGQPTVGGYDVSELFSEISVPLTDDLELWGAYRYSDYSNIGGVNSFATALSFSPSDKARFRVGYQQAVRAPNVSELFLGTSNGFPSATDPCSAGGFVAGRTSVDTCIASGVAANQVGVFTQANSQIQGNFGGTPTLTEESSDTFTVGVVLEPTEGIDITLDYFSIDIEDAIDSTAGGVDNILDICYNFEGNISSPFCQLVTRRPDGNVGTVNAVNANTGGIETSGIDFTVNYVKDLDFGIGGESSTLNITTRGTYLLAYDETPAEGFDIVNKCAGNFGNTCESPRNELIVNSRITWASGPWSLSSQLRYLSAADDDRIENDGVAASSLVVPEIDAEFYLDISGSYQFSDDFSVNAGVNNILDTEPTVVGRVQEQANTFPSTYDLLGPRIFLSASYKFQ